MTSYGRVEGVLLNVRCFTTEGWGGLSCLRRL